MRRSKRQAARKENNIIKLPLDIVDDVLQFLPANGMAHAEAASRGMRAAVARAVPRQIRDTYWLPHSAAVQPRGSSWASLVRQAHEGLEARLLARAVGDVIFRADGARYNGHLAGVYELQDGGRTLVNGRPTYKLVGKAMFLFYGATGAWLIGRDTSSDVFSWSVTSAALTPDRITKTWIAYDSTDWQPVAGAKVVRATAAARRQEAERVAALEAEARGQDRAVGDDM